MGQALQLALYAPRAYTQGNSYWRRIPMPAKTPASRPAFLSIRFKVLIPLMILLTSTFICTYSGSQYFLKTVIIRSMKQEAVYIRDAALLCLDPDMLGELTRDAQADPKTDWRLDDRYIELQECLLYGNINYERASLFTYYKTGENTFAYGVDGWQITYDAKLEDMIPFGEEMTLDLVGEEVYELLPEGLLGEKATEELSFDEEAEVSYFDLASPIQDRSGKMVGGIIVVVDANEFIESVDTLSILLFGIFIIIYFLIAFIVLVITGSATSQLRTLDAAARRVAEGDYTPVKVKKQVIGDEVSILAGVFNTMLEKIRGREEVLKQRVAELEIVIDCTKRKKQVQEIVDSEFFQDLAARAAKIRQRKPDDKEKPSDDSGK
jgi:HAMP domain-containing protein